MVSSTEFHKDFASLRIATHEIGVTGVRFLHELRHEAITALLFERNNPDFSWKAVTNTKVQFALERENDHSFKVHLIGEFSLSCTCARCLEPVSFSLPLDFFIRMLEMEHLGIESDDALGWNTNEIELDLSAEDEDVVGYFSEKSIDLGLIIRDQIFMLVPDYPHCDMGKDALQASRCKVLSKTSHGADQLRDNPFVKRFGKTK